VRQKLEAERAWVTYEYDPVTLLTERIRVPGLNLTEFGYDTRGRLTSVTSGTRQSFFSYGSDGFLSSVTDPENRTATYDHDAVGRVTGVHRPDSSSVYFTYDRNGNMTVLTNPNPADHGFGYNSVNRNTSYQTPLSGSYQYVYDRDRRLTKTVLPSGNEITNVYEGGKLTQTQFPEGTVDYLYYPCGSKVQSVTKDGESLTYDYDGSLLTSETLSGTLNGSLSYAYNNDFAVKSFNYAGGTENLTYDSDGLLTGAGRFTVTRNAENGLPVSVTDGTLTLSRTFNSYGETESQAVTAGGQGISQMNLTRSNAGRITAKNETSGGVTSDYLYTYDPAGRLLTVTKNGVLTEEYRYNANGSRIYEMNTLRGIAGRSMAYSAEDHLLTAGDVMYTYSPDGFLTAKTAGTEVTACDYSSRGELMGVTLPGGTSAEYVHDPLGRRIAKKVNGVISEKYLWSGLTTLLAVYDGSNNLLMRFEYADARMPFAVMKAGVLYYMVYDQVGSMKLIADSAGNVVKSIEYDSFGNIISDSNPNFAVPFGFAGGLHDRHTGLVRFGYRDYDPETGRWTAKDPIGFAGGDTDLYGYCLNDPVNFSDPDGLISPNGSGGGGASGGWSNSAARINWGKQGKHIPGHNNYTPGRSIITSDPAILAEKAGTGQQISNTDVGTPGSKERVNFGETIGTYTDPILVFFGTEIAYAPKQFFSARLRGFSGQKRMFFHFQHVRQKSCQRKPKLDQYILMNQEMHFPQQMESSIMEMMAFISFPLGRVNDIQ